MKMKRLFQWLLIAGLLVAIAFTATAGPIQSGLDSTTARKWSILHDHVDRPSPAPESADAQTQCWGKATFALAAYATDRETDLADLYLIELAQDHPIPLDRSFEFAMKFPLPLIMRAYLDRTMGSRMGADARAAVREMMWRYAYHRSRKIDAHPYVEEKVWRIQDSENLDLMHRSISFLATQALKNHGDYAGATLADGFTLTNHYTAWAANLKELARSRASQGLTVETASPTYAKYSLHAMLNIADFSESAILADLMRQFVILYFADVAQEFLPATGVRGGAQNRTYKDKYLTQGTRDGLRDPLWVYGWHDNAPGGSHPMTVGLAASRFQVPAIVTAIATANKPAFQYTTRRFGLGTRDVIDGRLVYDISFDEGAGSHIVRDSYVAPNYVMGSMTIDPGRDNTHLNGQNRFMGVLFDSHVNARIAVVGRGATNGDGSRGRTGYFETQGVLERNCMIVGREPNVDGSPGTDIYISYAGGLWDNWSAAQGDGWFFTRTDDTYVAVRIAGQPDSAGNYFTVVPASDGVFLELIDANSPVIIEVAGSSDFVAFDTSDPSPFETFQQSILANSIDIRADGVAYVTENADTLEFFAASDKLPRINGSTVNVNPDQIYASPYLTGRAGETDMVVQFPGMAPLKLSFDY